MRGKVVGARDTVTGQSVPCFCGPSESEPLLELLQLATKVHRGLDMKTPAAALFALVLISACAKKDPGPVTYKTGVPDYTGDYDGTKAVAYVIDERFTMFVPRDCPSFTCANVLSGANLDKEALGKACPKAQFLSIVTLGKPTVGKTKMDSVGHSHPEKGTANGLMMDEANEIEVINASGPIVARVHVLGSETVEGIVSATLCPKL